MEQYIFRAGYRGYGCSCVCLLSCRIFSKRHLPFDVSPGNW